MTSGELSKVITKSTTHQHGKYWPITKWVLILLGVFFFLYLGTLPVRGSLTKKYLSRGDSLLAQEKYLEADLAYRKALLLSSKNAEAANHKELIKRASGNILELEPLVKAQNLQDRISLYTLATSVPKDEVEAARLSRQLIEKGAYQLAIIPAKTATEMDKTYRDGWIYLGLANLKTATLGQLDDPSRAEYTTKAKEAFEKASELDPTYEPTIAYLKSIGL